MATGARVRIVQLFLCTGLTAVLLAGGCAGAPDGPPQVKTSSLTLRARAAEERTMSVIPLTRPTVAAQGVNRSEETPPLLTNPDAGDDRETTRSGVVRLPLPAGAPFTATLALPTLCRYEPPLALSAASSAVKDLGDIAVKVEGSDDALPTGFLELIPVKAAEDLQQMVADVDQNIRVSDIRHDHRSTLDEWRVRVDSATHASGAEHWILLLKPAHADCALRLDWDNTHLQSHPGHRNPLFEEIAERLVLRGK